MESSSFCLIASERSISGFIQHIATDEAELQLPFKKMAYRPFGLRLQGERLKNRLLLDESGKLWYYNMVKLEKIGTEILLRRRAIWRQKNIKTDRVKIMKNIKTQKHENIKIRSYQRIAEREEEDRPQRRTGRQNWAAENGGMG